MNDDDLLARLRAADPADSLPPADPTRVARLLEDAMRTSTPTPDLADPTRLADRRARRTPWIAAAAVAAVLALVAGIGLPRLLGDEEEPRAASTRTVSRLDLPEAVPGRCMAPNAELLTGQDTAFDGVVTAVDDGVATLEVSRWYRGAGTDVVEVRAPGLDQRRLLDAVRFRVGSRYLVAGHDGSVVVCGVSGDYTDDLADLYLQAFGG